jgi:hypothetical protein
MVEGEIEACQCRMRFVYRGNPHAGAKAVKCSVDLRGPGRAALPRLCRHSIPLALAHGLASGVSSCRRERDKGGAPVLLLFFFVYFFF